MLMSAIQLFDKTRRREIVVNCDPRASLYTLKILGDATRFNRQTSVRDSLTA